MLNSFQHLTLLPKSYKNNTLKPVQGDGNLESFDSWPLIPCSHAKLVSASQLARKLELEKQDPETFTHDIFLMCWFSRR